MTEAGRFYHSKGQEIMPIGGNQAETMHELSTVLADNLNAEGMCEGLLVAEVADDITFIICAPQDFWDRKESPNRTSSRFISEYVGVWREVSGRYLFPVIVSPNRFGEICNKAEEEGWRHALYIKDSNRIEQ